MGFMIVLGPCFACDQLFTYNADKVPSIVVDGDRKPVCRSCVDRANPERIKNGLPPIVPAPDAYEAQEGY